MPTKSKVKAKAVAPVIPITEDDKGIVKIVVRGIEIFFNPKAHKFWRMEKGEKVKVKSVTKFTGIIDKPGLKYWAVNLACDHLLAKIENKEQITLTDIEEARGLHAVRSQQAKDIGTIAHEWIDNWLNGLKPALPENEASLTAVNAFLQFNEEHKVHWLEGELKDGKGIIYSPTYDYAGIFDRIAIIDGKRVLVDFKTSNDCYPDYALQTAAYQGAKEEMTAENIDARLVIRIAKETEAEYLARYQKKNDKLRAKGWKPVEVPPYRVFEPIFYTEQSADFKGFLGAFDLVNRLDELAKEE